MRIIEDVTEAHELRAGAKLYSLKTHDVWWRRSFERPAWEGSNGGYSYTSDLIKFEAPLILLWEPAP